MNFGLCVCDIRRIVKKWVLHIVQHAHTFQWWRGSISVSAFVIFGEIKLVELHNQI